MKRLTTLTRLLIVCFGMFLSFGVAAQQQERPQGQRQGQMSMQERNAQMLQQYKEQLNLTEEQVTKLEAINARTMEQQQALRKQQNATREEMIAKRREIREQSQAEIKAILTEEQAKKFEEMQAERRQRMRKGQAQGQGQRPSNNNN